jgi:hypothetical protein
MGLYKTFREDSFTRNASKITVILLIAEAFRLLLNFTLDIVLYVLFFGLLLKLIWTITRYESTNTNEDSKSTVGSN